MTLFIVLMFVSAFLLFYTYIGYPLLMLVSQRKSLQNVKPQTSDHRDWPVVSFIVAAYNEEDCIKAKIENSLDLDYPKDKLQLIVVSDGSTDRTGEVAEGYPSILHLHTPKRRGKLHAIKRATERAKGDITIFSDANTFLNRSSIKQLVILFDDCTVGAVSGEKRVVVESSMQSAAATEGIYWQYESTLKKLDARFYSVVGAAGELFAIRTSLFEEVPEDTILDDFMITLRLNMKGFRTEYTPFAYALEAPSTDLKSEYKRKVRIAAGGWQSMMRLTPLLNPLRFGRLSIQYISRRVTRWATAPISLVILFSTTTVVASNGAIWAIWALAIQIAFYALAFYGWVRGSKAGSISRVAFYFTFMHVCVMIGMITYFTGKTTVKWAKAERLKMHARIISD